MTELPAVELDLTAARSDPRYRLLAEVRARIRQLHLQHSFVRPEDLTGTQTVLFNQCIEQLRNLECHLLDNNSLTLLKRVSY